MTTPTTSDTFYSSIPVFRGFASLMDPALYSALPDDWTHRRRRYRGIDQGDRGGALQGGQHGRRLGHRGGRQCAGGPRVSVRVRRRRREFCGVARRSRAHPRGDGGDRDLGRGEPQPRDAGGAGAGVGGAGAGPRRPRRPVRAVGQSVLCDVFRRRPRLGGDGDEARRVRGAEGRARHPARSHGIVVPVRGNSLRARPHPLGAGGARARRRRLRLSQGDRGHRRAGRAQPGCRAAGAAGRPAADMAAERQQIRSQRECADRC